MFPSPDKNDNKRWKWPKNELLTIVMARTKHLYSNMLIPYPQKQKYFWNILSFLSFNLLVPRLNAMEEPDLYDMEDSIS